MLKLRHLAWAVAGAVLVVAPPAPNAHAQTDADIRQRLIAASIASYPGACPCPYNTMRNGRRCGGNSAWSKRGGYAPLCYAEDVTPEMVRQYRQRGR
jgi:hypothetical protein